MHRVAQGARKIASIMMLALLVAGGMSFSREGAAQGSGAVLGFAPASGTHAMGRNFTVRVTLNSGGGAGVNAADGTVKFDPEYLSVVSASKDGSIFSLWTSEPAVSNGQGTVQWSGGNPAPYTGNGGTVIAVTFRPAKEGSTKLTITGASALSADGKGTNVLTGTGEANITIEGSSAEPPPPPPPPPTSGSGEGTASTGTDIPIAVDIKSTTHPDPEKWYSHNDPEFSWTLPPDAAGVSAILTDKPDSVPPRNSEGIIESKSFENVEDGAWYFHIRFRSQSGVWSTAAHRKVLVDTKVPENFEVDVRHDDRNLLPRYLMTADDEPSGIDRFEVAIEGKDVVSANPDAARSGGFSLPPLLPGSYKAILRAVDRAGNAAEQSQPFEIEGRAKIEITNSPGTIDARDPLIVEGLADRNARVTVRIEQDAKAVVEDQTTANSDGEWIFVSRRNMKRGDYEISAKMVTRTGAETEFTAKIPLTVVGAPFIERFGWILVVMLFLLILGLGFFMYYQKKELAKQREKVLKKADQVRMETDAVFAALDEEVAEKIQLLDEETATKLGTEKMSPNDVLDKFREALGISRDAITREIEDVEEELEE